MCLLWLFLYIFKNYEDLKLSCDYCVKQRHFCCVFFQETLSLLCRSSNATSWFQQCPKKSLETPARKPSSPCSPSSPSSCRHPFHKFSANDSSLTQAAFNGLFFKTERKLLNKIDIYFSPRNYLIRNFILGPSTHKYLSDGWKKGRFPLSSRRYIILHYD